jgi:hypothetical protein
LNEAKAVRAEKHPQAEAWGYTDEARLRGLKSKAGV